MTQFEQIEGLIAKSFGTGQTSQVLGIGVYHLLILYVYAKHMDLKQVVHGVFGLIRISGGQWGEKVYASPALCSGGFSRRLYRIFTENGLQPIKITI